MSLLLSTGVLFGLSVPPTGPVVRGLWRTVVPADRLATAYAFDSGLSTATFVTGPMVAGGLLLVLPIHLVIAVTGSLKVTGDLLVTVSPIVRDAVRATAQASARWSGRVFGPLVHGRVRLLLVLILLDTFTFGAMEVSAVASASGQGSAGLLTSAFALGGAISGIGYGARVWPGSPRAQLLLLGAVGTVVLAAGTVSAELVAGMVLVGVVFVLFGLANGPVETLKQVLIGEVSPEHQRIEVFSWVFSIMWLGFGLGTVVAGLLAESGEAAPTLLVATAAQLVAVLVTVVAVAGLRRPHPVNT
jgi:MFS family permease